MEADKLVELFQQGRQEAFAELFQLYKNPALRSAFLLTGNSFDAENVLQEAFLKCYQNLPGLREPASFKAWFWRILTRTAWAYCKRRDREIPAPVETLLAEPLQTPSTLDLLAESEEQQLLTQAIHRLPLKQKTVIVLFYYDELSVQEIAKVTGTLAGTVKSRLFTARRNLAQMLEANEASISNKEILKSKMSKRMEVGKDEPQTNKLHSNVG